MKPPVRGVLDFGPILARLSVMEQIGLEDGREQNANPASALNEDISRG
jgi:hypothetical protein